jgi:PAS domain S-box-containing protein
MFSNKAPRFSIRAKLLIAFVGLSILPMVLVSAYGLYVNVRTMEHIALQDLTHDVATIRSGTANFMSGVEGDMRVLLNSSLLRRWIRSGGTDHPREDARILGAVADAFLAFAQTRKFYYQIILVNADRDEILRIQCDDVIDSASHCTITPQGGLRRGGGAYYELLTRGLAGGQIAFRPVELSYRRSGRIPVITFAAPLVSGGVRKGILIVNLFAGSLFRELETRRSTAMGQSVILAGGDGHYVYDSREQSDWNRLIALREEDNLEKDYGPSIAAEIVSGREGVVTEGSDAIIAYAPLIPSQPPRTPAPGGPAIDFSLFVFETVPRASLTGDARAAASTYAWFLLAFLGCGVGLGLMATGQFTRPISEVRRGAEVISRGNYRHRLKVKTGDEIEELAGQFNRMAASLEEHEREIQQHRYRLEEMVGDRTRELGEEKGRLQAILDNVPSAFVMLDPDGRIRTASAAFSSITGLELAGVRGKDIDAVLEGAGLCLHGGVSPGRGPSRAVEVHVDGPVEINGSERFLEHMTIPITEAGSLTSILQIITDVTKRKRLEEHLIHSEKLMATGEMAAIIAHGFRNSLTSIKMILQLQQESRRLGAENRRSVRVALDSIYRMETVVQDLLNFARPSPMQFHPADLNALVEEALALVAPRSGEHAVALSRRLGSHIPQMPLDGPHVREAVVNILLNALQAIESRPPRAAKGRITVMSKRVVLTRTLRDLRSPAGGDMEGGVPARGAEIVLQKGLDCVSVSVGDNGPGIDRAIVRRIFDPFFTTKTNGTGLGLPMVKRTVNAHGGIVTVRSTKGKGAVVEIILPLRLDAPGGGAGGGAGLVHSGGER